MIVAVMGLDIFLGHSCGYYYRYWSCDWQRNYLNYKYIFRSSWTYYSYHLSFYFESNEHQIQSKCIKQKADCNKLNYLLDVSITILLIIHRPVFHSKHDGLDSVSVYRWNLLSWVQQIKVVYLFGHQLRVQALSIVPNYQISPEDEDRIKFPNRQV
jgi:hypothetical protein